MQTNRKMQTNDTTTTPKPPSNKANKSHITWNDITIMTASDLSETPKDN